ncbi:MAG: hydrogenase nickel incorporation protein HypB [Helicobacteraceae bacterium]|jgi:hydrogenase nickel incorporation protein HypB|nr:hydrogenase nickel incorporation protein HypB [Helicobacteraceae bacterium]
MSGVETIMDNPKLNKPKTLEIMRRVLESNDQNALENRRRFDALGVLAINLMSSPGSGKTTLLEATAKSAAFRFAVIEGDMETNRDADRLKKLGVNAYQICTGSACHLEADMVQHAMSQMSLDNLDVVFVENVGNLVCPASYELGTHINVVLLSTPEGDDKVMKYPVMFRTADLVLITKSELADIFDFNVNNVRKEVQRIKPAINTIALSAKTGEGFDEWLQFINNHLNSRM